MTAFAPQSTACDTETKADLPRDFLQHDLYVMIAEHFPLRSLYFAQNFIYNIFCADVFRFRLEGKPYTMAKNIFCDAFHIFWNHESPIFEEATAREAIAKLIEALGETPKLM